MNIESQVEIYEVFISKILEELDGCREKLKKHKGALCLYCKKRFVGKSCQSSLRRHIKTCDKHPLAIARRELEEFDRPWIQKTKIPSHTTDKEYMVTEFDDSHFECTCPHFVYRDVTTCKHIEEVQ